MSTPSSDFRRWYFSPWLLVPVALVILVVWVALISNGFYQRAHRFDAPRPPAPEAADSNLPR